MISSRATYAHVLHTSVHIIAGKKRKGTAAALQLTLELTGVHGFAEMLQSANARQADQILHLQAEAMQTQAIAVDNARLQKEIAQSQKVGTGRQNRQPAVFC